MENLFNLLNETILPLAIDVDGEAITDPFMTRLLDFLQRFQDRLVDLNNAGTNGCEDSCLVCSGALNATALHAKLHNGGYVQARVPWAPLTLGSNGKMAHGRWVAHRIYYFLTHAGEGLSRVSIDQQLGHYCIGDDGFKGTRKTCVRHVRPVTQSENMQEGIRVQRVQQREAAKRKAIEELYPLFPLDEDVCAWAVKYCQL
jgi:hypothetical protein